MVKPLPSQSKARSSFYVWSMLFSMSAVSALLAIGSAHAQPPLVTAPEVAASATQPTAAPTPRYAANDLERAFTFMDRNHDGKVSREEAVEFRGVARHFDQADTNRDGFLSIEEFGTAMNYVKPQ